MMAMAHHDLRTSPPDGGQEAPRQPAACAEAQLCRAVSVRSCRRALPTCSGHTAEVPELMLQRREWVHPGSSQAMRLLEQGNGGGQLPACLYHCAIAPYLHFDAPLPNQLYAVGGRNEDQEALPTVEMFDTWHGEWVRCPDMLLCRAGCAAAALPDGQLLVVGGYDRRGIVEGLLQSCESFDPVRQQWSLLRARLKRPRWGHGCGSLGGKVYAAGGCSLRENAPADEAFMETLSSCEVYDPETDTWQHCSPLNTPRAGLRVVTLGDRYLAAVGGCDDVFGQAEILASIELFDSQSCRWSVLRRELSAPRTTAAVAALDDREILIFGGAPSLSSCEVYGVPEQASSEQQFEAATPDTRKVEWPSAGDLAEGRMGCQAITIDLPAAGKNYPLCTQRCVVVIGGENGDEDWEGFTRHFSSVLVYDVEDGAWRPQDAFPHIPTPRSALALCSAPGRIFGYQS